MRRLFLSPLLLFLAACGGGGTASDPPTSSPAPTPSTAAEGAARPDPPPFNIVILTLDACRADALGCYGLDRPTTPAIDEVARDPDSVIFRSHHVQGAWTKASVASLFTGVYVKQHGVVLGHKDVQKKSDWRQYLVQGFSEDYDTLPERMHALGFETFGVVKSYHLDRQYGFAQGFDTYLGPGDVHSDEDRVETFLRLAADAKTRGRRYFSYVHLNSCHYPFEGRDRDPEYMGLFPTDFDEAARKRAGIDFETTGLSRKIRKKGLTLTPEDAAFARLIYEAKLRRVDRRQVTPFITGLKDSELYDDTLILVTADHGEELYDHGGYAHGHGVWEEVVHVPLIVKFPKGRRPAALGASVAAVTQAVDLLPTLTAFAGGPMPRGYPGADIFGGPPRSWSISETKRGWALIEDGWKAMGGKTGLMLFNLAEDPGERNDLAPAEPERAAAMQKRIDELLATYSDLGKSAHEFERELEPEEEENLRSLGYLK